MLPFPSLNPAAPWVSSRDEDGVPVCIGEHMHCGVLQRRLVLVAEAARFHAGRLLHQPRGGREDRKNRQKEFCGLAC
ncbi:hypothetical protein SAMN05216511_0220 [Streptomyces sp. KS_16]|nr:hypothetical protein SAMN05216511_0220 [Streptomyces sp. KS_16]